MRQYAQRLEVVSPGGFPPGITPANVLDQQNPRNRRLAEALARCGLIERSGQGMNLMFERAIRQGKAQPDFVGTRGHEVRLNLPGLVGDPASVRFLERLGEETLCSFSTHDFLVLDGLNRDQPLSETLKSRLPRLVDMGAVEATGRGRGRRYLLSQRLYGALGAKGVYTRKKGLDRDTNKVLLLRHIERNAASGAPMGRISAGAAQPGTQRDTGVAARTGRRSAGARARPHTRRALVSRRKVCRFETADLSCK